MAHWTSPRPRDDVSPPSAASRQPENYTSDGTEWRRRFIWVSALGVALVAILLSFLTLRNQDVTAVADDANKKLRAIQIQLDETATSKKRLIAEKQSLQNERDDALKKLSSANGQIQRLKSDLDQSKADYSRLYDKVRSEQTTPRPSPARSPR